MNGTVQGQETGIGGGKEKALTNSHCIRLIELVPIEILEIRSPLTVPHEAATENGTGHLGRFSIYPSNHLLNSLAIHTHARSAHRTGAKRKCTAHGEPWSLSAHQLAFSGKSVSGEVFLGSSSSLGVHERQILVGGGGGGHDPYRT